MRKGLAAFALVLLLPVPGWAQKTIFSRYPKASGIGFATIPGKDEGGLSLAAVNRMTAAAVKGLQRRK